jgi:hypothetical protein
MPLFLVGELLPPEVDGHRVQANDIDLDPTTRTAVIGYNMAGDVFAGAMQVVDFRDAARPVLLAEVLFHDADVSAVLKKGTFYYAGLACGDPTLPTPAVLREFRQFTAGFGSTGQWLQLPSWAVTDLASTGNAVVAACGAANGALVHVDRTTMRAVASVSEIDARAVCFDASGDLLGACGTGMLVRRALPDLAERARASIVGYGQAGAKGTIEAAGGRVFLGAGDGGFQVRDLDGNLLEALDNRSFENAWANLAVTNAASVRGNLAFVAAGALGVQVVDLGRWTPGVDPNGGGSGLVVLGEIDFGDDVSSNMVKARSDILLVAGGLGGVKLVRMGATS